LVTGDRTKLTILATNVRIILGYDEPKKNADIMNKLNTITYILNDYITS